MIRVGVVNWQICYLKDKRGDYFVVKFIKIFIIYGNYYLLNKYYIIKVYFMFILKCII